MIPLRSGSKRVPSKNKRLLRGRPLPYYIIQAVISSGAFEPSDIYINSEDVEYKVLADHFGINFYHRPEHLASDKATNDDFLLDFIDNHECETIFQFLATSPLLTSKTIADFTSKFISSGLDTGISFSKIQIEANYNNEPINFDRTKQTPPSQSLTPILSYACGMMAWNSSGLRNNIKRYSAGYHGGSEPFFSYILDKIQSLDIDTEEDFFIVESILERRSVLDLTPNCSGIKKLWSSNEGVARFETYVPSILKNDGVNQMEDFPDQSIISISTILNLGEKGMYRLVNTQSNSACLITQSKGEGNRLHYHPDWDEWWLIMQGEWLFEIDGSKHYVKKDDLVKIPRNSWHKITAVAEGVSTRLAVSRQDVVHAYK